MALHQEAQRMAKQFEFTTDALNKGVKEFITEMGTWSE
jgi:hexokinase